MSEAFYRRACGSREEWLTERNRHLQASDAASIDGSSPWKSAAELYDEKTGMFPAEDISGRPYVQYGIRMEPVAREAFMLDVPYFSLEYHQYDILVSKGRPYMGATLDGELTVISPMKIFLSLLIFTPPFDIYVSTFVDRIISHLALEKLILKKS